MAGTVPLLLRGTGSLDNRVAFFRGLGVSDSDFLSRVPVPRLMVWVRTVAGYGRLLGRERVTRFCGYPAACVCQG